MPGPFALEFDGENIWVANYFENSIDRLNLNGELLQTIQPGIDPISMAFDGKHLWVVLVDEDSIAKINPKDGDVESFHLVPKGPREIIFDNERVFVANSQFSRPYNNLGVSGATVLDVISTTRSSDVSYPYGNNPYFDLVLRNGLLFPDSFQTVLEQAISLDPYFVILFIGNNDILGAAASGLTIDPTTVSDFEKV